MANKTVVSSGVAVVVSAWHYDLADAYQAQLKAKDKALAMVQKQYSARPTFEQYKLDLAALKSIAEEKGRSYEWLRKCYAAAIVELFEALPISDDPEAARKRAERAEKKAQQKQVLIDAGLTQKPKDWVPVEVDAPKGKSKAGAPKGQTQDHPVSRDESVEQLVARFDTFELLDALARILADDKTTELEAAGLASIASKLRTVLKPREVAKAVPDKAPRKPRATQSNQKAA
jgi:hypothetical protein